MFKFAIVSAILSSLFLSTIAHADYYSCARKIYSMGMLRKYDYKGQTWAANTRKSGAISSTTHVYIETTTSSLDPGVTTGNAVSSTQYTSSWGECAMVDMQISRQFRDDYIEQNLHEIKKQVAMGNGYHLQSLAVLSGCMGPGGQVWTETLQKNTETLYDATSGKSFSESLDAIIHESQLNGMCAPPTA